MKTFLLISVIICTLCACNPSAGIDFNLETVFIGATLNNTNPTITLGDTLTIKAKLPEVITSTSGNINVKSLQRSYFYMKIFKIDTVNNRASSLQPPLYWTTNGSISNTNGFCFLFNTDNSPYEVIINFKAQVRGIYYLEVVDQAGQIRVNNAYDGGVVVNFNVPSRNINIAAPFATAAWVADAESRVAGTYVFRVI